MVKQVGKRPGAHRPKGSVSEHTVLAQEMRKTLIEAAAVRLAKQGKVYAIP